MKNQIKVCGDKYHKFQIFKLFHIASFDSWVFCTLNNYFGALIISQRSDTPTCDRYHACIRGPSGMGGGGGWLPLLKGGDRRTCCCADRASYTNNFTAS